MIINRNDSSDFTHYETEDIHLLSKLYPTSLPEQYGHIIEFVKEWILSKFEDGFFKEVYVDQSMVYKKVKRRRQKELLKYQNPQIGIFPKYDDTYDRDTVDMYLWGVDKIMITKHDESFIHDRETHNSISLKLRNIKVDFDVRIKLSTKIQQINLYENLKIALRTSASQDIYTPCKIQMPFDILNDMYYEYYGKNIIRNDIDSINHALKYFNDRTKVVIEYELDKSNGDYYFYLLVDGLNHRIKFDSISIDDGEQEGDTYSNFMIDMSFYVNCPAVSFFYRLFSDKSKNIDTFISSSEVIDNGNSVESIDEYEKIEIDSRVGDFELYLQSTIEDVDKGDLSLSYSEIFGGLSIDTTIEKVFNHCIEYYISPSKFIEFVFKYNNNKLDIENDYKNGKILVKNVPENCNLTMLIYLDAYYMKSILMSMQDGK